MNKVVSFIKKKYRSQKSKSWTRSLSSTGIAENDIIKRLRNTEIDVIFDVGANIGQSSRQYIKFFPKATIHAFEPIKKSFVKLQTSTRRFQNIKSYQVALGSHNGVARMSSKGTSKSNSIVAKLSEFNDLNSYEEVKLVTGYEFCKANSIGEISLLKIDAEGYDLEVLKGFELMLNENTVKIIQVEAGMNRENKKHVYLWTILEYLEAKGYHLFWLYEQVHEIYTKPAKPILRRVNAVFLSNSCVNENLWIRK